MAFMDDLLLDNSNSKYTYLSLMKLHQIVAILLVKLDFIDLLTYSFGIGNFFLHVEDPL